MKRLLRLRAQRLGLTAATVAASLFLAACAGPDSRCQSAQSPFNVGDLVRVKVDGRVGYVLYKDCWIARAPYPYYFKVRVPTGVVSTNSRVFKKDDAITVAPYIVEEFRQFELEAAQ